MTLAQLPFGFTLFSRRHTSRTIAPVHFIAGRTAQTKVRGAAMRTVQAPPHSQEDSPQPRRVVLEAVARRDAAQRLSLALALLARAGAGTAPEEEARSVLAASAPETPLSRFTRQQQQQEEGLG